MPEPVIFHLNGHPGVGKLTIARAMATLAEAQGRPLVVVDNHLTGDPVRSAVEAAAAVLELAGLR